MRRNDDAELLGSMTPEGTAISHDAPNTSTLPIDVARACYALALAVLDGDQDRARSLARTVIGAAIERAAGLA